MMETGSSTSRGAGYDPSTPPPPPAEKASVVEDFIDIFHAPSSVFARRANAGFGIPLLIVSVISAIFAFANRGVMAQIFDAEYSRRAAEMMAKNPQMTAEALESGRGLQAAIGTFFGYIGTPLFILFMALFVWLLAKTVSAKITYGQAALVTTLAWIPRLLGLLVTTIQVVLMDTSSMTNMFSLTVSPARLMDADTANPKLFALAGSFDLFSIWSTILIGIGIAVIGRVSRGKGLLVAAILFVLGTLPLLMR